MKSRTKYYICDDRIKNIFMTAGLGSVSATQVLNAGEYNTAYRVDTDSGEYVLKIAPLSSAKVLTYEQNLMAQEVYYYQQIADKTSVKIPKVYHYDNSCELIESPYFIMERLSSLPLNVCKLSKAEKIEVHREIGRMAAKLHSIKNNEYGYKQNGLHDNWYDAIKSMVNNLVIDCTSCNKKVKKADELLHYIEQHKAVLMQVDARYTHYDIWDGNIFYSNDGAPSLTLIDTERSFWGDSIGDFVSIDTFTDIRNKVSVQEYNKTADQPITFTSSEMIRYYIMRGYLGLIIHTEKYFRYNKSQLKYWVNIFLAKIMLNKSLKELKRLAKSLKN